MKTKYVQGSQKIFFISLKVKKMCFFCIMYKLEKKYVPTLDIYGQSCFVIYE